MKPLKKIIEFIIFKKKLGFYLLTIQTYFANFL